MNADSLRDIATDALRYWEPRRLAYNLLLVLVVGVHFAFGWPDSVQEVSFNGGLFLFVLAVLANAAYCAAYPVDLLLQFSHFREQRGRWRAAVLAVGFAFAAVLTHFFALGIFRHGDALF